MQVKRKNTVPSPEMRTIQRRMAVVEIMRAIQWGLPRQPAQTAPSAFWRESNQPASREPHARMSIGKRTRAYRIRANHPTSAPPQRHHQAPMLGLSRRRIHAKPLPVPPPPKITAWPLSRLSDGESRTAGYALAPPHAEIKPKAYPCPPTHSTATNNASATPRQDNPIPCLNKRKRN